jgi:hypothetical protein
MVRKINFFIRRIYNINITPNNNSYPTTNSYPPAKKNNPRKNNFLPEFPFNENTNWKG